MRSKKLYIWSDKSGEAENVRLNETIFHSANGYIGVRGSLEEGYDDEKTGIRGQYINGFYDIAPMKQAEQLYGFVNEKQVMLNAADTQGICIYVDGEKMTMKQAVPGTRERILDMDKGYTLRRFTWESSGGKRISAEVRRMASFEMLPLFLIDYSFTAENFNGEVEIISNHEGAVHNYSNPDDPRVAAESGNYLTVQKAEVKENRSLITSVTKKSGLKVTTGVGHAVHGAKSCETTETNCDSHSVSIRFRAAVSENEPVRFVKYTVMCDSRRFQDTDAEKLLEKAMDKDIEEWYSIQEKYLNNFWEKVNINVDGDDVLACSLNFNLYCLLQSASKDSSGNIAAKGLSGEGYEGHYFWDTEMYILPFFMLNEPSLARNLLEYRYHILDQARENAKILGHKKGALFPWRTIAGQECSGYYPSGTAQYHINSDIAYAVVNYYLVTKDMEFLEKYGAEILIETARLWIDTGHYADGKFQIHCVTGPDEYTCLVNNNYYTNSSAKFNLQWAVKCCDILKAAGWFEQFAEKTDLKGTELEEFLMAAEKMYLPYCEELDINPQDDSFLSKKVWNLAETPEDKFPLLLHYHPLHLYRYQVCKQADTVLAHFIHEDMQPLHTIENSFKYYEKITTHDSSLSTCIFSIVASRLGEVDKAYNYFSHSSKLDITNAHGNTGDGIHTANMGGTYMGIVYGFGGLRIKEQGIVFRPSIPGQWSRYSYRICYENSLIEVETDQEKTIFRLISGEKKTITVYDTRIVLDGEAEIPVRTA